MAILFHTLTHTLTLKRVLLAIICSFFSHTAYPAINYAIEQQVSSNISRQISTEQNVWLKISGKPDVYSLYKKAGTQSKKGAVIILHDLNANPDWPNIIQPLRNHLPHHNWSSLSIQMPAIQTPVSAAQLDATQILELQQVIHSRILAGVEFLKVAEPAQPIVLIAQGMIGSMALKFVTELAAQSPITAIVLLSSYDHPLLASSEYMQKTAINVLDIIAENDWPKVISAAEKRLKIANLARDISETPKNAFTSAKVRALAFNKTGNLRYRQKIITGANHDFGQQTELLLKTIRGWMNRYHNQ